jgi:PIN domain nuclease of toxin-antitoxin system
MDDDTLSTEIKELLDVEAQVFLSAASIWEIGIKQASGKLAGPSDLIETITASGLAGLPVTARHAAAAARLPMIHSDPFDRMLIAQARMEHLTLITRDTVISAYEVEVLHA